MRKLLALTILLVLAIAGSAGAAVLYASLTSDTIDAANQWATTKGGATFKTLAEINADGTYILAANGKTIAINQNVTALRLSTAVEGGDSTAGGGFTVSAARTITANVTAGTSVCLTCSHTTGSTVTVNGTSTGGSGTSIYGTQNTSTGAITITSCTGGSGNTAAGLRNDSTGIVTATNATGGNGTSSYGIYNVVDAVLTVTNATGGGNATAFGLYSTASTQLQTLTNVYGSPTTAGAAGIKCPNGVPMLVTGNIINTAYAAAIMNNKVITYNPGVGNYIEYPKTTGGAGTYKFGLTYPTSNLLTTASADGANAPAAGTFAAPTAPNVLYGAAGSVTGTYHAPSHDDVRYPVSFGVSDAGLCHVPGVDYVIDSEPVGVSGHGMYNSVASSDVLVGVAVGVQPNFGMLTQPNNGSPPYSGEQGQARRELRGR